MTRFNQLFGIVLTLTFISSCNFNTKPGSFHYTPKVAVSSCASYASLEELTIQIQDSLFYINAVVPALELTKRNSHAFVICFESDPIEVLVIQPSNYGSIDTCYIKERYGRMKSGQTTMWEGTEPSKKELIRIQTRLNKLIKRHCVK